MYGYARHGPESLTPTTVDELPRGDPADGWNDIPAGSIKIDGSRWTGPNNTSGNEWTGYMKMGKLYITIDTIEGRNVLIAIARNLHRTHA